MKIILSEQEKKWLTSKRYNRLTDGQPVLISPMGAERFLYSVLVRANKKIFFFNKFIYSWLFGLNKKRLNLKPYIQDKKVLVIPGYANNAFIFAEAGANSVTVYDKDPITIAWLKAIKKYYYYSYKTKESSLGQQNDTNSDTKNNYKIYPSIADILQALTAWYPPLLKLPKGNWLNLILFIIQPNELRHRYLKYMAQLIEEAVQRNMPDVYELDKDIQFFVGDDIKLQENSINKNFDTVYIPYLLGIENGVSEKKSIMNFIEAIFKVSPNSNVFITPSRSIKQFNLIGHKYLLINNNECLKDIAELEKYFHTEDKHWMRTQGLILFKKKVL